MIGENETEEYSDEIMTKKREMEQQMQAMAVTDWAGIMMVCIHGQVENRIYGAIVNRCLEEPVSFCGLDQLVLKMEDLPCYQWIPAFYRKNGRRIIWGSERSEKRADKKQRAGRICLIF